MARLDKAQSPAGGPGSAGAFAGSEVRFDHTAYRGLGNKMSKAADRRDRGLQSSLKHANDDAPGWTDRAVRMLERFGREQSSPWTCEQFRAWADAEGLDNPAEKRAFGAVIQAGLRAEWFERVGYAPAASSNCAPKPQYLQTGGRSE